MNEYLAKLHSLESGGEPLTPKKTLVRVPAKPTKLGSVSFDSDPSRAFFAKDAVLDRDGQKKDMQNRSIEGLKSAYVGHRQNRQNLVADPFPFAAVLDALEARCPDYVEPRCWHLCIEDARNFLLAWGDQAEALGWTAEEPFGLDQPPTNPHPSYCRLSRYDRTGLIWHLVGSRVVALTANTAAIENATTGNVLIYRKARKPALGPVGDSLDDFTA